MDSVRGAVGDWFSFEAGPVLGALDGTDANLPLVPALLELIEQNSEEDFGTPGPIVSFIERFSPQVYTPFLVDSLMRNPHHYNVLLASRLANTDDLHVFRALLGALQSARDLATDDDLAGDMDDVIDRILIKLDAC